MKKPAEMSDAELIEALELAAPRIRLAAVEEFRQVADVIAELALEATRRLRDVLEITGPRPAPATFIPGPLAGKVRNVTIHADGRLTCELEIPKGGAEFIRQIGGRS
jgi:hypothetical protein